MSLERFILDPWKMSHDAYDISPFHIRPAPEYATAEVLVASLYRSLGFENYSETDVIKAGREFDRASKQERPAPKVQVGVRNDTWSTVLHNVLESPKQPNQSSKRFLQLTPMVPDIALYSGTPRLSGNSWNAGVLIQRMVQLGSDSNQAANDLWNRMFEALSVGEGDDIWARWLREEFERRKKNCPAWKLQPMKIGPNLPDAEKLQLAFPARQFVRDVDAILAAKSCMTRRQWITLLESVLRLGSVTHVLWLCDVNHKLWEQVHKILNGGDLLTQKDLQEQIVSCKSPYLAYGNPAIAIVRDYASRYLVGRIGINLLLWNLEKMGISIKSLSSCSDLHKLLSEVVVRRADLQQTDFLTQFEMVRDEHLRTIACKKGIGSHLVEFASTLGQRQTANESLRGYDQGYLVRKRSDHKSAPWIVSFGPVAVLALVHCCLREAVGPRSVQRLCEYLSKYGIDVDCADIAKSELGRKLRMLGLVLDSPDAESGMLLVPPFNTTSILERRSKS